MTQTQTAASTSGETLSGNGLEVISIAKSYDKRAVLSDISLSVAKGEVLGLLAAVDSFFVLERFNARMDDLAALRPPARWRTWRLAVAVNREFQRICCVNNRFRLPCDVVGAAIESL